MANRDDIMRDVHQAGRLKRYHTWPTITTETVGHHSWAMIMIYSQLFESFCTPARNYLVVRHIAAHDLPELHTGDMPFPVKKKYPKLGEAAAEVERDAAEKLGIDHMLSDQLDDNDKRRVKLCDLLQMFEFGMHEVSLGNVYAMPIVVDTVSAANKLLTDPANDSSTRTVEREKVYGWLRARGFDVNAFLDREATNDQG